MARVPHISFLPESFSTEPPDLSQVTLGLMATDKSPGIVATVLTQILMIPEHYS